MSITITGLDEAIERLQREARSIELKAARLRKRVAEAIELISVMEFMSSNPNDLINESPAPPDVTVSVKDNGNVTLVIADGKDAIWMEFGAGVFHNGAVGSAPNPLAQKLGYTIGGYGKGHGKQNTWGYYDNGELHLTHGVPASMPLYKAVMKVVPDIPSIAEEVFRT